MHTDSEAAHQRVVMPLGQFKYLKMEEFAFSDGRLALREFDPNRELPDPGLLSEVDVQKVRQARWAIVATGEDLTGYKEDVSLLLMTFRLFSKDLSPIIRFRFSEDKSSPEMLMEVMSHDNSYPRLFEVYDIAAIGSINKAYMLLRGAEHISPRLKNSFYFLYVAFHVDRWSEGLIALMIALEALFSKDARDSSTDVICRRVTNFVADQSVCTKEEMVELYDTRSLLVHGKLQAGNAAENLSLLARMEKVAIACFCKMIRENTFSFYANKPLRDQFLNQFDNP